MDLSVYLRVIWRFKYLVAVGVLGAVFLAVLATARISFVHGRVHLAYRTTEVFQSQARILVTQQGFPWGRTVLPTGAVPSGNSGASAVFADPNRLYGLATFYAQLANSDAVQSRLPRLGAVVAGPIVDKTTGSVAQLPIVGMTAISTSPNLARELAAAGVRIFIKYIAQNQAAAQIPVDQRVSLQVLNGPGRAQLVQGRKKTLPIVVFMTALIATLGLAFILENLRPRVSAVPEVLAADHAESVRRTA